MNVGLPGQTRFLLIRHGQTEWNARQLWQGHRDSPLTALGRAQADELAAQLAGETIQRLVCSDLDRCQQTAAPLARLSGLTVELRRELRELDVGSWSGLGRDEIRLRDAELLRRFDAREDVRPGGGEKRSELARRVHAFVEAIASESPGSCIALVTHSGVVRALHANMQVAEHARVHRLSLAEIRAARSDEISARHRV